MFENVDGCRTDGRWMPESLVCYKLTNEPLAQMS